MIKSLINHLLWKLSNNERRIKILRKKGVKIGEGCEIWKSTVWGSEPYLITVGNRVRITANVKFVTHDGGMWVLRNMKLLENADKFGQIEIGDNVHIGWDVTIMPGVKIGSNCVIGCGAVVTKSIPDNSVAAGVPARVLKTIDAYYEQSKDCCDHTKNLDSKAKREYLTKKYSLDR